MILVTTPNGKVGHEVAKKLLEQRKPVRLAAHTVAKTQGAFPGAEVVPFDLNDEASVRSALRGIEAVYLASPGATPAEPVSRMIDVAKEAGVRRLVRLSAMGAEGSDNPLRQVEQHLQTSGLEWTILRPNWFMQNYSTTHAQSIRKGGIIAEPTGDAKTSFIDTCDIAAVAVKALIEEGHQGQAYTLTGGRAYDRNEVAHAISQVTGKEVRYEPLSEEMFQERMSLGGMPRAYLGMMISLYQVVRAGHTAQVTDTVQRVTGRAPTSFEAFAEDYKEVWL